jgi:CBS domain containing-hemolysin-like protein
MDPIIWAAVIAGGVSVIGNVATVLVSLFGRRTLREQIESTESPERDLGDQGSRGPHGSAHVVPGERASISRILTLKARPIRG